MDPITSHEGETAIIIEPVFGAQVVGWPSDKQGQDLEYEYYGPDNSGFAYTTTSFGPAYLKFVAGLPIGVPLLGQVVDDNDTYLDVPSGPDFGSILSSLIAHDMHVGRRVQPGRSGFDILSGDERWLNLETGDIEFADVSWFGSMLSPKAVFEKLEKLKQLLGDQYVEWSIFSGKDVKDNINLLRIDSMRPEIDFYEFADPRITLFRGMGILAACGERTCDEIIIVRSYDQLGALADYDSLNSGYLLVVHDELLTGIRAGITALWNEGLAEVHSQLTEMFTGTVPLDAKRKRNPHDYTPINPNMLQNAVAVLTNNLGYPAPDEFITAFIDRKQIFFTGKFFGITDGKITGVPALEKFKDRKQIVKMNSGELPVYSIKTRVFADQKQQKAIVQLLE